MAEKISAGELIVDVAADVSELKSGFAEVRNTLKKGNEKVGAFQTIWTGALRRVGEKATDFAFKAIKAPFSIALKSVVAMGKGMANLAKTAVLDAARFQTGLAEVATLGVEDMEGLRQGILGVSSAIGQDLPTATKAAYQAISAGIPEGNVIDFLAVGAKAAVAGVTDMETAVDALSTAVNAYGEDADQAMKFSDQFFQVIKLGKTTFAELAASIGMVLPTAAAVGVTFDEVGGALALMTKKGINTSQAVTSLNALLMQLLTPAEGSADAVERITNAAGGLANLDLSKVIDELAKLDTGEQVDLIGSIEAVKALLSLQDAGLGEAIKSVSASLGATEKAFSKFEGTFEFEKGKLFQSLINFGTELATPVATAIGEVFALVNEHITPALPPIAAVIKDWFTDLWEGGFDQQTIEALAQSWGISIEEAMKQAGVVAGAGASLKSTLSDLATRIGEYLSKGIQRFEAAPAGTPLTLLFAQWAKDLRENMGPEMNKIFGTEFTKKLGEAWEKNKASIMQIAEDIGAVIGRAIMFAAIDLPSTLFAELLLKIADQWVIDQRALVDWRRRVFGLSAGPGLRGPKAETDQSQTLLPASIKAPATAIQQLAAPSMNQGSGGGGIGGGQPINITINQAAGEDSQSMVNRLREMLLDIERFGNTRGLVAGQAHG